MLLKYRFALFVGIILLGKYLFENSGYYLLEQAARPPLVSLSKIKSYYNKDLFYYTHTLELEHLGDLHGSQTSLGQYNATEINGWLNAIAAIDQKHDLLAFIAAYYFPNPRAIELTKSCVSFLVNHSNADSQHKWRWQAQALFIARYVMQDEDTTKAIAESMRTKAKQYQLPLWTHLADINNKGDLRKLYDEVLNDSNVVLSKEETAFIINLQNNIL